MNSRHIRWCTTADEGRRGHQLLALVKDLRGVSLLSPIWPTFEAIKCERTGALRSSTVDLVLTRDNTSNLIRIETYTALPSDYYPVAFDVQLRIERVRQPRRLTKTLLQSKNVA